MIKEKGRTYVQGNIKALGRAKKKRSAVSSKTEEGQSQKKLTDYQQFAREMRLQGKSFAEIGHLWREKKSRRKK